MTATLRRYPWLLAYMAAFAVWVLTMALSSGRGALGTLDSASILAVFTAIVGLGQMFVIAAGNGNVDLSIPSTMTLAGYLSVNIATSGSFGVITAVFLGLATGLAVGLANAAMILGLRVPPIIATLSSGYILQSLVLSYAHHSTDTPNPILSHLASAHFAGPPTLVILFAIAAFASVAVLRRSAYGRTLLAHGQNATAAYFAGLRVNRVVIITYAISGIAAGLAGVLLAAYAGGAALDIATPYLLTSIAVVVLGGTAISGGIANIAGVWGGAVFLTLLQNLLNVARLAAGWQYISEGLTIILVLTLFSRRTATRV
jgi:ribose transport system permease protein